MPIVTSHKQKVSRRSGAPRVLVVEDQDDVRLMLTTVLQMEGYGVDEASNALEGLECLRRNRYDLVLTDYAMPGGTGTWMLQQAARDGRLERTAAIVVTAHPELIRPSTGFTVVGKPIDLDRFLDQIRRVLNIPSEGLGRPQARRTAARIELVLYVSEDSPASIQAREALERVLSSFNRAEIEYAIRDMKESTETAERDRVVFTPTLVRRRPVPQIWIVGDLRDGDIIADLLRASGVSPVK